jgi:NADH-quinone oxidoreductase subunit G
MPKLTIDNREIQVPEGTKVIEAAESLGIMIPRFCYHKTLGSVGACRTCAVMFLEGPVKGVEMSCMVDAKDGMVVSTTDPEAVEFRKYVIEWLMMNHPHDCPVCDEGGHCLLQDETVSGGHGIRRYLGKKRTYTDQNLGPFVQHEMNRCIHCFRCRRFYQDFAGYEDLGAMQIGSRTYFGRESDGALESPFSGNLIDICPTGVYTDKPARYKGRRWDLERGPSLCLHCSLGCNTTGSARYREVLRQEARLNEHVNGYFICDRGRYGFDYANHPERPRRARVGDREVTWVEGIEAATSALSRIRRESGPKATACLGSSRNSLETQGMLRRICHCMGWREPWFFVDDLIEQKVKRAVSGLDARVAVSMRQIEEADFILVLGADPVNEAPMLALAMRQACRKGGRVVVIDPRPVSLPFEYDHIPVDPGNLERCFDVIVKGAFNDGMVSHLDPAAMTFFNGLPGQFPPDFPFQDAVAGLSQKLRDSRMPVIVAGTDIVRESTPAHAADHVRLLQSIKEKVGLFYVLAGPNAFGAALLSPPEETHEGIIEAIEKDKIKALLLVECDPFYHFPDRERLSRALGKLDLLIVLDYLPSQSVKQAHILLPTVTLFEKMHSCFANQEGRVQNASPIHAGGIPLSQISHGLHPPRTFLKHIPGGEPKAAGDVLSELASGLSGKSWDGSSEGLWAWLTETHNPIFARMSLAAGDKEGTRLIPDERSGPPFSQRVSDLKEDPSSGDHLELLMVDRIFGTEELSSYSRILGQAETPPHVIMHSSDANRLGFKEGDKIVLPLTDGGLEMELHTATNMARGVLIVPRHRAVSWQKIKKSMKVFIRDILIESH